MSDDILDRIDDAVGAWEARPDSWMHGDPLHPDPRNLRGYGRPGGGVQFVRPMIQLRENVGAVPGWVRCRSCETYWVGPEPCFVCGEHPENENPPVLLGPAPLRGSSEGVRVLIEPIIAPLVEQLDQIARLFERFDWAPHLEAWQRNYLAGTWRARSTDQAEPHRPRELPIDGDTYHRRRRARARRR